MAVPLKRVSESFTLPLKSSNNFPACSNVFKMAKKVLTDNSQKNSYKRGNIKHLIMCMLIFLHSFI